jgi:glycosyltransferase involved in cell wall biosynthesis
VRVIASGQLTATATADSDRRPSVLMVTGAYYPELSGGGLQAREVVRALRGAALFTVLTTSTDPLLPVRSEEDGVAVWRIAVDVRSAWSQLVAAWRIVAAFFWLAPRFDMINLHGFSRKAILLVAMSRLLRKPFALTLQTGVHDEPEAARAMGRAAYWAYSHADLYLSVSPGLSRAYLGAGLSPARLRQVCNAVDVERFTPADADERRALRKELGLPLDRALVLCVGYFSRDKRPDLLYEAWSRMEMAADSRPSAIVFVGATRPTYQEVDAQLAAAIRERAGARGLADRLFFVESTRVIEKYFKAVDLYVLPSIREGLPIALLEAMSSRLPCVATRLPGSTDVLIEHGVNGLLVEPDDPAALAESIRALLSDSEAASRLGSAARETVVGRYSIQRTAPAWLSAYKELVSVQRSRAVGGTR